ncbi:MAG: MarR family transcriptional regulator, partial [Pseudomonadota bacterium]
LLDDSGALSIQTAANRLGTSHVSVLQVAKAMEGAGLLQRKKSPHDKRVALLSLTQDGTKIASQVLDISQRVDKAARGLIEAAAPDFIDHLTALENALQETPFAARIGEVAPQISTPKEKTSD